jgi:hypothetical protein
MPPPHQPSSLPLSLAPPPTDGVFESVDDAIKTLNIFAAAEGYVIIKRRSRKSRNKELRSVDLKCEKGRSHRSYILMVPEKKQQNSGIRLTDYPFQIELYPA